MLRNMDINSAHGLIKQKKTAHNWTGLQPRHNHAGSLIGSAQLVDDNGIFIPGLTFVVEVKAPIVATRCLYIFSLMLSVGKDKKRIYQLEVCPSDKRSHNGSPIIYGPHSHVLELEVNAVVNSEVDCNNWSGSVDWFMKEVNLTQFAIPQPC